MFRCVRGRAEPPVSDGLSWQDALVIWEFRCLFSLSPAAQLRLLRVVRAGVIGELTQIIPFEMVDEIRASTTEHPAPGCVICLHGWWCTCC